MSTFVPRWHRFSPDWCCERFRDKGQHETLCPDNPGWREYRLIGELSVMELRLLIRDAVRQALAEANLVTVVTEQEERSAP